MAYKKVVFNAGNPLDVNELNQLSANITESIDAATASLTSAIDNATGNIIKTITKVVCGTAEVTAMKKDIYGQARVQIPSSPFDKNPIVTVTVAEDIATEDIDFFVLPETANSFIVKAKSTGTKRTNLKVNWIAAQMQEVKTT